MRRNSRKVMCGNVQLGGNAEIAVQSMLNLPPEDIAGNISKAKQLEAAGCDIIRIAVPNKQGVKLVSALKENIHMPVVADIHFNYTLAIEAINAGCDKVRINPGNIGGDDRVKAVVKCCSEHNIPIRIGVNSGSLEKEILEKYGSPTPEAMCESAIYHASLLEKFDFSDIVISLKSSNVNTMIKSYKLIADKCDYPLHLGVTETGTYEMGIIKSSVGIGSLICEGIGDTIRVSLTEDTVKEVEAAKNILKACGAAKGINIISCPTCGRTKNDLIGLVKKVEAAIGAEGLSDKNITVAIMGCVVNGPGEAKEADLGIACGADNAILFAKGEKLSTINISDALNELVKRIKEW